MKLVYFIFVTVSSLWIFSPKVEAKLTPTIESSEPLYEMGVFASTFLSPDYPAAAQSHTHVIALPYFIYRGPVFRTDKGGGITSRLYREKKMEFDFSVSGAFPARSDQNEKRKGMDDLDWMFQFGPRLKFHLGPETSKEDWQFLLPLRAIFSTDLTRVDARGFVLNPSMVWRWNDKIASNFDLSFSVSSFIASQKAHDYFYSVTTKDMTSSRPAYHAKGGYMGTTFSLSVGQKIDSIKWFAGVSARSHHGSVNKDSPLFVEPWTYGAGIGLLWKLYESEVRGEL